MYNMYIDIHLASNIDNVHHLLFPFQVVVRSREFRREARLEQLRSYFYGKKPHNFFPFSFDIALSDVEIFKIGGIILCYMYCI